MRALRAAGLGGAAGPILAGRLVALASGIVTALLASRVLGAEGRGVVVSFAALQYLLATSLALGTGSATYLLASRRDFGVPTLAGGVLMVGVGIAAAATVLVLVGEWLGALGRFMPTLDIAVVLLIGPAAASQYIVTGMIQLAMGSGRATTTMVGLALGPIALLVATILVATVDGDARAMVIGYVAAWATVAALVTGIVARGLDVAVPVVRRMLAIGGPAAVGDVSNALSYRADVLLLAILAGPAAVGVYSLAVQAMEPLWLLAGSAAGGLLIALPGQKPTTWRAATVSASVRVGLLTTVGTGAVVVLMPLLVGIVGPSFSEAPLVAIVLAPAIIFLAVSKTLAVVPLAGGRLWWGTAISTVALAANIVANVVLVPQLGAVGAAAASVLSYGLSALLWIRALGR